MRHNSTDNDNGDLTVSLCMLASGSKGNCIHISAGGRSLLVDAGLSGREIERRMRQRDLSPDNLLAIVVSHEHADHIRGVGVLARRVAGSGSRASRRTPRRGTRSSWGSTTRR